MNTPLTLLGSCSFNEKCPTFLLSHLKWAQNDGYMKSTQLAIPACWYADKEGIRKSFLASPVITWNKVVLSKPMRPYLQLSHSSAAIFSVFMDVAACRPCISHSTVCTKITQFYQTLSTICKLQTCASDRSDTYSMLPKKCFISDNEGQTICKSE